MIALMQLFEIFPFLCGQNRNNREATKWVTIRARAVPHVANHKLVSLSPILLLWWLHKSAGF